MSEDTLGRTTGPKLLVHATTEITIETTGPGFTDMTARIAGALMEFGADDGLVNLFLRHTSASLTIQENVDPDVLRDLTDALERAAPMDLPWRHDKEGPDDMPAHIKTMLSDVSLTIPVAGGVMRLGTWQAIYLVEHRTNPHTRRLIVSYMGN